MRNRSKFFQQILIEVLLGMGNCAEYSFVILRQIYAFRPFPPPPNFGRLSMRNRSEFFLQILLEVSLGMVNCAEYSFVILRQILCCHVQKMGFLGRFGLYNCQIIPMTNPIRQNKEQKQQHRITVHFIFNMRRNSVC